MSLPVNAATGPGARRIAVVAGLVATIAGCGTGGLPGTAPPSVAPATVTAAPVSTPSPPPASPTPVPPTPTPALTAQSSLPEPPGATLSGIVSGPGDGILGSFTWDGAGSDAPWIVPPDASRTEPGAALGVAWAPAASPVDWTARWAPVTGSGAGDVVSGVDGVGPVAIVAPGEAGAWSLQLEAAFGLGRTGTWYWRLEVGP
jgi:hypothetical protein